jgi:hypothetical protein
VRNNPAITTGSGEAQLKVLPLKKTPGCPARRTAKNPHGAPSINEPCHQMPHAPSRKLKTTPTLSAWTPNINTEVMKG